MRKYRSYIFLILLLFGFLSIGYFLLGGKEKKVEILEINFVSDHAIVSNSNEMIPEFITTFAACFTENDSIDYISKISFKRSDIFNDEADVLLYKKASIDRNLTVEEAEEMFKEENKSLKSTIGMFAVSMRVPYIDKEDTNNTRYFYLVSNFDPTAMNSAIHFDQPDKLKEHINQELKSGTLFKGKNENKITIIILKGNSSPNPVDGPNQDPGPKPVPHEPDGGGGGNKKPNPNPEPIEKRFAINSSFIELKQNTMSWSTDLKKYATSIKITYSNGRKILEYDVTGANQHVFNSGDKDFDAVQVKVTLKVELPENIKLNGKTQQTIYPICEL